MDLLICALSSSIGACHRFVGLKKVSVVIHINTAFALRSIVKINVIAVFKFACFGGGNDIVY